MELAALSRIENIPVPATTWADLARHASGGARTALFLSKSKTNTRRKRYPQSQNDLYAQNASCSATPSTIQRGGRPCKLLLQTSFWQVQSFSLGLPRSFWPLTRIALVGNVSELGLCNYRSDCPGKNCPHAAADSSHCLSWIYSAAGTPCSMRKCLILYPSPAPHPSQNPSTIMSSFLGSTLQRQPQLRRFLRQRIR